MNHLGLGTDLNTNARLHPDPAPNDLISVVELCQELGLKKLTSIAQRFGPLGTLQSIHNGVKGQCKRLFTQAEADIIRTAYGLRRAKQDNRYARKPEAPIRTGRPTTPEGVILHHVARYYGVQVAQLLSRNRAVYVCYARMAAAGLLRTQGYSVSHIGRILERDHSTVLHSLNQCGLAHDADSTRHPNPARQAQLTAEIHELEAVLLMDPRYTGAPGATAPSFDALLDQATKQHPAAVAIRAYVSAVVCPSTPQPTAVLYHGLSVLSADSVLRERIYTILARIEKPAYFYAMGRHAAQCGFSWEASA